MDDRPLNCVGIDPTKQQVGSHDFRPTVPLSTTAGLPELTATPMQPLIERVARAICSAAGWNPDEPEESSSPGWKEHVPEAQAAIAECRVELDLLCDPRRWTREMNDAWHIALTDTQAAFAGLRATIDYAGDSTATLAAETVEASSPFTPAPATDSAREEAEQDIGDALDLWTKETMRLYHIIDTHLPKNAPADRYGIHSLAMRLACLRPDGKPAEGVEEMRAVLQRLTTHCSGRSAEPLSDIVRDAYTLLASLDGKPSGGAV